MIKLIVGFALIAIAVLYLLSKGGDIDMGGEKHGTETPAPAQSAPAAPVSPKTQ